MYKQPETIVLSQYLLDHLADLDWRGMDLVEVAPAYDHAQITALAGAAFVWSYLCGLASRKVRGS